MASRRCAFPLTAAENSFSALGKALSTSEIRFLSVAWVLVVEPADSGISVLQNAIGSGPAGEFGSGFWLVHYTLKTYIIIDIIASIVI
jgi:hypothetical protein